MIWGYHHFGKHPYTNLLQKHIVSVVLQGISGEAAFFSPKIRPHRTWPTGAWRESFPCREKMQPLGQPDWVKWGRKIQGSFPSPSLKLTLRPWKSHRNPGKDPWKCWIFHCDLLVYRSVLYNQTKTMHYYMGNGILKITIHLYCLIAPKMEHLMTPK